MTIDLVYMLKLVQDIAIDGFEGNLVSVWTSIECMQVLMLDKL